MSNWNPNTTIETLKCRAKLLNIARQFFQDNHFLEVDTPCLSQSTTPDPNIESFTSQYNQQQYYLHTSPEFPMKRLLASGSGAIYQICKVFRQGEAGCNHNPEFTLIEWYQPGIYYRDLMEQLDDFIRLLLKGNLQLNETVLLTYQQAFEQYAGFNPLMVSSEQLHAVILENNIQLHEQTLTHNAYLDLIMSYIVQPALPKNKPVFIYDYPVTQAALANVRRGDVDIAERFELFINGLELANGYQELLDATEQQQRFENENRQRLVAGQQTIPVDDYLISALQQGMPMVSGVALGFERVLMLATGKDSIRDVIAFTMDKA